uniref:JNK1/MAPK8-associated membrane protein n=1 Tax=Graphocephala atropunctata TaxID=36148 RepID=A0A1B6KTR5_9HEMI
MLREKSLFYYSKSDEMKTRCPGEYCGRIELGPNNYSDCGACPRGFRSDLRSICMYCEGRPELYDWLYLGFMTLLPLVLHWFCIDNVSPLVGNNKSVLAFHLCALVEVSVAAALTVWLTDPFGQMDLRTCNSHQLSDWYTLLHNPQPNYEETIHCTQEAVYPLYTMVLTFYCLSIIVMLLVRPFLVRYILPKVGKLPIYAALYFFPILALLHALFGGLIYFTFPYIVIILSVISNAAHFAYKLDQSMMFLVVSTVSDLRNILILLGHWALHTYGLAALPVFHWSLIGLVPLPAIFYILTARFTDPNKLHTE